MPRLPGFESLGGVQADSSRPVGSYDVTPFARGAQALAQGAQNLGRGISDVGTDLAEVQRQHNDALAIDAHANAATQIAQLHTSLQNDKDYTTLEQRYSDSAQKIINDGAATIPNEMLRNHFIAKTRELSAHVQGAINRQSFAGMVSADDDALKLKTQNVLDDIAINPGNPARGAQVDALGLHVDNAVARGWKTQEEGALLKRQVAIHVRTAEAGVQADNGVIPFPEIGSIRPRVVAGLSQPADVWAGDNQAALQAKGIPVAITSAYRDPAHNAAVGGARGSQHLSGDAIDVSLNGLTPSQQQDVVTQFLSDPRTGGFGYYPKSNSIHVDVRQGDKAAWGTDYHGTSVGQGWPSWMTDQINTWQGSARPATATAAPPLDHGAHADWRDGAPVAQQAGEGALREDLSIVGTNPVDAAIDPLTKYRLNQRAQTILDRRRADNAAAANLAASNRSQEYALAIEDAKNGRGFIPPLEMIRSDPLIKGTSHELSLTKAYDEATSMGGADAIDRKMRQDPAAFALGNVPVVSDAWGKLQDALHGGGALDAAAAAHEYAEKTKSAQQSFGLSPHEMILLPKPYINQLGQALAHPEVAGGADQVAKRLEAEQKLWGPQHFPDVFRQMSMEKNLPPVVRVVGSGAMGELPARRLIEMSGLTVNDILHDQSEERAGTVRKDTLTAMAPFLRTLAGSADEMSVFQDYKDQAEKLAAYYVSHGKSSSEAGAQAFKDVLGNHYDFIDGGFGRDSFRIPKARDDGSPQTFTTAEIEDGAAQAKANLGKKIDGADLDVIPPAVGGFFQKYLGAAPINTYRRDAVWATASGDVGLRLVYDGETVRTKDGQPLVLSWDQLAAIARGGRQNSPAASARFEQ